MDNLSIIIVDIDDDTSELISCYAVNIDSGQTYPVPQVHPSKLGQYSEELGEWVM